MLKRGCIRAVAATVLILVAFGGTHASEPPTKDRFLDLMRSREHAEAVEVAKRLLSDSELQFGSESLEVAEALEFIAWGMAMGRLGTKAERLDPAVRALAIKRSLFGDSGPEVADGEYWVGFVHYFSEDVNLAVQRYESALRIAKAYYGDDHAELERYAREYGASLYLLQRYQEAMTAFEELYRVSLDKYGVRTPGMVKALFNLALVHKVLNELDESERLYGEVIGILEAQDSRDDRTLAQALDSYANLLSWQGRLEEALDVNARVLELRRGVDGPKSESVAGTLTNRARILEFVGDYEEAQAYLEESLEILSDSSVAPGLAASTRVNLAVVLRLQGRREQSMKMFASALQVMPDGYPAHRWHREYATLLAEVGDTGAAREQLELALQSLAASVGRTHVDYGNALAAIGALEYREGKLEVAREKLEAALRILESQLGRQHPVYVRALEDLAVVHRGLDEKDLAFEAGLEAESLSLAIARSTLSVLPERIALAQTANGHKGRDVAVSIALIPGATDETRSRALDAVIRSRAVVFDEMVSRSRFYSEHGGAELEELREELRQTRTRLASLFISGPQENPDQFAELLRSTRRDVERLEESLARRGRKFRLAAVARSLGLDESINALPKGAVLLSFARYDRYGPSNAPAVPSYLAVVARRENRALYLVDLGPAARVDRAIQEWRDELEPSRLGSSDAAYRKTGKTLRHLIWDPLERRLGGASLVLIVPDGPINLVSFGALPKGESGYLVENGPALHYLTAERDLARTKVTRLAPGRLLLIGNPAYFHAESLSAGSSRPGQSVYRSLSPVCRSFESKLFSPLPGTEREVRTIEGIWKKSMPEATSLNLSGESASESAVKASAPGSRVLHFATHGFYLGGDCAGAQQFRGVGGLSPGPSPRTATISPLLLSGVVLAGANSRSTPGADDRDDGILTAEEISALSLADAELAVLSVCRGGSGSVAEGEGVFGLRRAFLVAGTTTVVSNLWDVEDRSAQDWIERFYDRRFAAGASVPAAIQAATIGVLDARRASGKSTHPFFWGGWIAAGGVD